MALSSGRRDKVIIAGAGGRDASRDAAGLAAALASSLGADLVIASAVPEAPLPARLVAGSDRTDRFARAHDATEAVLGDFPHRRFDLSADPVGASRARRARERVADRPRADACQRAGNRRARDPRRPADHPRAVSSRDRASPVCRVGPRGVRDRGSRLRRERRGAPRARYGGLLRERPRLHLEDHHDLARRQRRGRGPCPGQGGYIPRAPGRGRPLGGASPPTQRSSAATPPTCLRASRSSSTCWWSARTAAARWHARPSAASRPS